MSTKSKRKEKKMSIGLSFKKRGSSIIDIIFIVILLLTVAFGLVFAKMTFDDINDDLLADDDLHADAKATLTQVNSGYTVWSDAIFGFLFFGLVIFLLISSYLIDSHPVFLIISALMFIFVVFGIANVSNTFEETMNESEFTDLQADYPIMMFIMTHLVLLITITFALMLIILYGKQQGGGIN